jgi:hypothetical protein
MEEGIFGPFMALFMPHTLIYFPGKRTPSFTRMEFCFLLMLAKIFSLSLGVEYSGNITTWGKREGGDEQVGKTARLCYYVSNNTVRPSPKLSHRSIYDLAEMYENGFDSSVVEGAIKPKDAEKGTYLIDGYETPVNAVALNSLFIEELTKRMSYTKVCVGVRPYFNKEQSEKVGHSFSSAFRNAGIRTAPETLCECAAAVKHLDDGVYNILVVSLAGTRTVFALYKVTVAGEDRAIESLFYSDFESISDSLVKGIVYKHILRGLEAAKERARVKSEEDRNVTFYPKQPGAQLFENYADISPIYKEVVTSLNDGRVDEYKPLDVEVRNSRGRVQFLILGSVIRVADIREEIQELIRSKEEECRTKMAEVVQRTREKIGDEPYRALLRSDFWSNQAIFGIFPFEKMKPPSPDGISIGAAYIADNYFKVTDPLVFETRRLFSSTEDFRDELATRTEYFDIAKVLKEDLGRETFRYLEEKDCKRLLELFQQKEMNLETMRRTIVEYKKCKDADARVKRGKDKRDPALKELKKFIAFAEKAGSDEDREWEVLGVSAKIEEARSFLNLAVEDESILGNKIEDVLFDLKSVIDLFARRRDERLKKEREAEEQARKLAEEAVEKAAGDAPVPSKEAVTEEAAEEAAEKTVEAAEDVRDKAEEVTKEAERSTEIEDFELGEEERKAFEQIFGENFDFGSETEEKAHDEPEERADEKLKQESVNQGLKEEL